MGYVSHVACKLQVHTEAQLCHNVIACWIKKAVFNISTHTLIIFQKMSSFLKKCNESLTMGTTEPKDKLLASFTFVEKMKNILLIIKPFITLV